MSKKVKQTEFDLFVKLLDKELSMPAVLSTSICEDCGDECVGLAATSIAERIVALEKYLGIECVVNDGVADYKKVGKVSKKKK